MPKFNPDVDIDWVEDLKKSIQEGRELCHAGCGDAPQLIRLHGRHVGAFCKGCYGELTRGVIPKLDPPKGIKSKIVNRKKIMER